MSKVRTADWYKEKREELLKHGRQARQCFGGQFTGPSEHFHVRTFETRPAARQGEAQRDAYLELIYATLVAWGMHRMGRTEARMLDWRTFRSAVLARWTSIETLWSSGPLSEDHWKELETVYRALRVSVSRSSLVGNSKTLAHLLPRAVAPIDREYTLRFLGQRGHYEHHKSRYGIDFEWTLFREHHERFFYPLIADRRFLEVTTGWVDPMCSTPLKAADSLIIGYQRFRGGRAVPAEA